VKERSLPVAHRGLLTVVRCRPAPRRHLVVDRSPRCARGGGRSIWVVLSGWLRSDRWSIGVRAGRCGCCTLLLHWELPVLEPYLGRLPRAPWPDYPSPLLADRLFVARRLSNQGRNKRLQHPTGVLDNPYFVCSALPGEWVIRLLAEAIVWTRVLRTAARCSAVSSLSAASNRSAARYLENSKG
jgi:hypothetical protein